MTRIADLEACGLGRSIQRKGTRVAELKLSDADVNCPLDRTGVAQA